MAEQSNSNWAWQYRAAVDDIESFARSIADPQKRRALERLANHYLAAAGSPESAGSSPGS
jgi:hypothetical protein